VALQKIKGKGVLLDDRGIPICEKKREICKVGVGGGGGGDAGKKVSSDDAEAI